MTLIGHACLTDKRVGAHKAGDQSPQNQHGRRVSTRDKEVFQMFNALTGVPANRQIAGKTDHYTQLKTVHRVLSLGCAANAHRPTVIASRIKRSIVATSAGRGFVPAAAS